MPIQLAKSMGLSVYETDVSMIKTWIKGRREIQRESQLMKKLFAPNACCGSYTYT